MSKFFKITLFSLLILFVFAWTKTETAQAGFGEWGSGGETAGTIQAVPTDHALTAIGYASDDKECVIGLKTAPVNLDGSIDFSKKDTFWSSIGCSGGTPSAGKNSYEKYFDVAAPEVITGWTWGANTSGGLPGDSSRPPDECFYQEYMNLKTQQIFTWGSSYDGSCSERGYSSSTLKAVAYAPAGRVIVGIRFNLDDDASLKYLAITTAEILPGNPNMDVYVGSSANKTANLTYDKSTRQFISNSDSGINLANVGSTGSILSIDAQSDTPSLYLSEDFFASNLSGGNIVLKPFNPNSSFDGLPIGQQSPAKITFTGINQQSGQPSDNSSQTIKVNLLVTSTANGQVDIKCDNSDGPCQVPQNSSATVSWAPFAGKTDYNNCSLTKTENGQVTSLGTQNNSGSFVTPVNNFNNTTNLTYTITCNVTSGGTTSDYVNLVFPGLPNSLNSCLLTANGSSSNLTITVGQSVSWSATSTPNNYPYFWHVSVSANVNDVPGDGTGKTDWSGAYTYSTAGTYQVYFHVEKDSDHLACPGGKSNTITLTVATPPPPTQLSCSPGTQTSYSKPYNFNFTAVGGTGTYSWQNNNICTEVSGNTGSNYNISCQGKIRNGEATVTSGTQTTTCCFGAGFEADCVDEEETPPPDPGALTAATDGYYENIDCGLGTDEDGNQLYCQVLQGSWQDPLGGTAPLSNVDLRYVFPGSASQYADRIDFDCTGDGTVDYSLTGLNQSNATQFPAFNLCNYPSAGIYTAKADVYSGTQKAWCFNRFCDDTATIQVNAPPVVNNVPSASNIQVIEPNYCVSGPAATVTWTYVDSDGDPQTAYQVQIDDQGSFQSPVADSGQVNSGNNSYFSGQGVLQFSVTYKARVRVWDAKGAVSDWTVGNSWNTPKHAYPQVDFTWSPTNPSSGQTIQFTDQTVFFDGGGNGQRGWSWNFGDGGSSTDQNPTYTYSSLGNYTINLASTDKDGYICSASDTNNTGIISIQRSIPVWKEVPPKP